MPRTSSQAGERSNLYQEITDRIISELEAGRVPWVQPWSTARAPLDMPHNASTRNRYSGINIVILWDAVISNGFSTNAFLTFRQALAAGGNVRKGARGTTVVYAKPFTPADEKRRAASEGREAARIPMLKRFTVFNTDQCDDLPAEICAPPPPIPGDLILPAAEALIKATDADFRIGGNQAFYAPGLDYVQVPRPDSYFEPVNWHRTAFHELGHWSGHDSRLNRDLAGGFGSVLYGREELVAEMAGAFICAAMGIEPTVRHADYLGSWLAIIREDNRAIVRAASAASRAADFILGFRAEAEVTDAEAALADLALERRAA